MSTVVTYAAGMQPTAAQFQSPVPIFARKTTNQALATLSTTLQNDTDLLWTVAASRSYAVDLTVMYIATGATPNIKFGFTGPSGAALGWCALYQNAATITSISGLTIASVHPATANTAAFAICIRGILTTSTTAGVLQLQAAQNTSDAATVTILASSHGALTQVT